ncbi:MAG: porin family protein [Hyphomonadaceae bacterium]
MKKSLFVAVGAVAAMCGTAQANDWSGLYVGGSIGTATRETEWVDLDGDWESPGDVAADDDVDATSIGAHLGYNWQWGNWVVGAQGGVTVADLSETTFEQGDVDVDNSLTFTADLRANAGYAFGNFLPYVTVGASYSDLEHSWLEIDDTDDSWQDFENETALLYGVGVQYAVSPQWTIGAEYLVRDFDSEVSTNPLDYRMDVGTEVDTFQVTFSYRIG